MENLEQAIGTRHKMKTNAERAPTTDAKATPNPNTQIAVGNSKISTPIRILQALQHELVAHQTRLRE